MIAKQGITDDLRKFLKEQIRTVLRLEVLLLLHHHQSRAFTAPEVANQLGFDNDTTAHELRELETIGVVVNSKGDKTKYKYHPSNAAIQAMIKQLALHYSKQRVPILSVMLAEHPDRTRLFAEAFRIIRSND